MFPIMDVNNKVIGFGGRVLGDGLPKYVNSPETLLFDKSRNLYGLNFARTSRQPFMIICEGYMDVIAMHQAGFTNAVASLGTAFTLQHGILLKRYTEEVRLAYDSDAAGIKAALRAIPILRSAGLRIRIIHMKPYKDPDEFIKNLGVEAFKDRIDAAENSFMFEVSVIERSYNLGDPEGKTRFFNEVAKQLLGFEQELERNNYIEAIARKYGISFENLQKLVNRYGLTLPEREKRREEAYGARREGDNLQYPEALLASQKLLLTWLVNDVTLLKKSGRGLGGRILFIQYIRRCAALYMKPLRRPGRLFRERSSVYSRKRKSRTWQLPFSIQILLGLKIKTPEKRRLQKLLCGLSVIIWMNSAAGHRTWPICRKLFG